jgi:hypothetical protein
MSSKTHIPAKPFTDVRDLRGDLSALSFPVHAFLTTFWGWTRVLSFGMIEQTIQTTTERSGETNALFFPQVACSAPDNRCHDLDDLDDRRV